MSTTCQDLRRWFVEGTHKGATHMIVVCDTWDWTDFPVYVMPGEDVRVVEARYDGTDMYKIMEVYAMELPVELQLAEVRAFHY